MQRAAAFCWVIAVATAAIGHEQRAAIEPGIESVATAKRSVPLDSLEVVFGLDTQSDTFGAAKQAADAVFAQAFTRARGLDLPALRERYDFAAISQDFLSIGRRGSKLRHRFHLSLEGLAAGRLHEAVVALIDAVLAVDKRLFVVEMTASLSDAVDAKTRDELVAEATTEAVAHARRAADAAGGKIGAPLAIASRCAAAGRVDAGAGDLEEVVVTSYRSGRSAYSLSTRESFALNEPFEAEAVRACAVTIRSELSPR